MTHTAGRVARIELPWPDKQLNPNARLHWARKAKAVKSAREAAFWFVKEAMHVRPGWASAKLDVVFCPPDNRRRDLDNLIASMKASNDGISDALGIDDSRFTSTYSMGSPVKGGAVQIEVRGI